ncbi:hypothetical protein F511_02986 [Dorcoceras hygrometricum]|uniref:Uncharacterized protein n=1 Tax=Dorcoceras hygrometricum TaxID=472368 RepID=A0A2Z7ADJ2_9LAMI|nr:hypothetical protein F511_02986 [Dorcoceras hygrometricum]
MSASGESSTTMHRLLHASGSHPIPTPYDPNGIRAHQVHNPAAKPNLKFYKAMAPSVTRTRAAAALRMKQIAIDNQSRMIRRLRAKLATERRESAATMEGLETKRSKIGLLQTIQGLQEDNGAPAPFDDGWEEEPEEDPKEEGLEDIPIGEGEIADE